MRATAKPLLPVLLALSVLALVAFCPDAATRNVFEGFSKAPTFTPPAGCMPREQTYGVLSKCETDIAPGRGFVAVIDTAVGWFVGEKVFVTDHVAEIKAYWAHEYPPDKLTFSSKASDMVPGNAPPGATLCIQYSMTGKTETVLHIEGLTCAWRVENPAAGQQNVELFWLEAYDEYTPSKGQQPMPSFDLIVRDLFASARL